MPRTRLILTVILVLAAALACHGRANHTRAHTPTIGDEGAVLVLGSGGLIGSALTQWLTAHHYTVLTVPNRTTLDLRQPGILADRWRGQRVRFAFLLACEVGGAKFIDSGSSGVQQSIINNNIAIYQSVLPYLHDHGIPFLFTSSYLQHLDTAYGSIKRLGEVWIRSLGLGKVVRLWNVYGRERTGAKAHVMTDWTQQCRTQGAIHSLTDGHEWRQFTHANDTADALGSMMQHYHSLDFVTELAGDDWSRMRDVARLVASKSPVPCSVNFADKPASVRQHLLPDPSSWWRRHSGWRSSVTLETGIEDLYQSLMVTYQPNTAAPSPAAATISSFHPSSMLSFSLFHSSSDAQFYSMVHRNFSSLMPRANDD